MSLKSDFRSPKGKMHQPDSSQLTSSLDYGPWDPENIREEEEEDVFDDEPNDEEDVRGAEEFTGGNSLLSSKEGLVVQGEMSILGGQGPTRQIVTLQSLTAGWTNHLRDSGYVPSPTSAHSFTFSSSEDEEEEKKMSAVEGKGVTPPINIPRARSRTLPSRGPAHPPTHPSGEKARTALKVEQGVRTKVVTEEHPLLRRQQDQGHSTPGQRNRTRSCPELLPSHHLTPLCSHTPVVVQRSKYVHQRNWSSPATTPEGTPIFTPPSHLLPPRTTPRTTRSLREMLIDLTEEPGSGGNSANSGHQRRVLVLAQPDLIAGHTLATSTTPEAQEWEHQHHLLKEGFHSRRNVSSLQGRSMIRTWRPAWHRPRALSCDVTLLVEVGQELRRISDEFTQSYASSAAPGNAVNRGVWRYLRDFFRRMFSPETT
ncbi:uncharacterized protein LOC143017796 [Oratosquilla oratoria]|uniref:uncharacterized protein LOC143017796 n=1 Tax=Oratosquilla oratoria TaxID=337810 RepID=UPI003F7675F0